MARYWSPESKAVYDTLDPRLQRLVTRIRDEVCDIKLTCGFRNEADQNAAFDAGVSKVRWPDGKHNILPSLAVDLQPYPYPKKEVMLWGQLGYIAGHAERIALEEGVKIRWGGDFNRNHYLADEKFSDLFHFEIDDDN